MGKLKTFGLLMAASVVMALGFTAVVDMVGSIPHSAPITSAR